ncbi:MAG: DNA repair protein RadA [Magnetococcales bacterium]|nr:DNA repair protein RadA [Magnetococcales bacterium]
MARNKEWFVCDACGSEHPRWEGQCRTCGAWNTLKALSVPPASAGKGGGKSTPSIGGGIDGQGEGAPVRLSEVVDEGEERLMTGIGELDRVLGGGLVAGSVVLIGGDPGIGKSTLLMDAMDRLGRDHPILYVSGEESTRQLRLRAQRLNVNTDTFWVVAENRLEAVERAVEMKTPAILVADSVQTLSTEEHASAAGTVTQVRECASRLIRMAKRRGMAVFLVGHVTKEGQLAGPRVLEHMVDTVLYFEGDRGQDYRILRAVKNRFGSANEIGVFTMHDVGLAEVSNPSELFLSERVQGAGGSVVFAGVEGTRPLLVEIQSLVSPSPLPQPRRTTLGFDANRLAMLTAVLEKRLGLGLFNHDIFLNVAGGFRITEPAADLAVAASLYASHRNREVDPGLVILGEVGLAGEIRAVAQVDVRLREAAKLGFTRCIIPEKCRKVLSDTPPLKVHAVRQVEEALELLASES